MSMIKYFIRRVLALLPVLFGAVTFTFILSRLMPGDPVLAYCAIGGRTCPQEQYDNWLRVLGLDKPMIEQYFIYLGQLFTGNWGVSSAYRGIPVWEVVTTRFFRTFDIALFSIIIAAFLGIKTGVISATHRNKAKDTVVRGFALVGVSIPVFWMGMLFQYLLAWQIQIFPATGYKTSGIGDPPSITNFRLIDCLLTGNMQLFVDYIIHLILPVLCLTIITLAGITRQTRSSMLEVLEQDYVRTARAKGCREKDVINTHARKNALIPTITVIGLNFGGLLAGAVLTESTFNLHGMGELLIVAINNVDYWVLCGVVFVTTLVFIIVNLGIDILYGIIDPRIRY